MGLSILYSLGRLKHVTWSENKYEYEKSVLIQVIVGGGKTAGEELS